MVRGGLTVHYAGPVFSSRVPSTRTPRPLQPNVLGPVGTMVHTGERAIDSGLVSLLDIAPKVYDLMGGRRRDRPVAAGSFPVSAPGCRRAEARSPKIAIADQQLEPCIRHTHNFLKSAKGAKETPCRMSRKVSNLSLTA